MKHSACHPERLLSFPNALQADCQAHWWVSSHRTAPFQEVGRKKGRKTPGGLVQCVHGGPVSLCFLNSPSLQIFGLCLHWSVPSMGFYTSAELGVVQGPRGDIWSRRNPASQEHVGSTGVTWRSVGLGCMRPLPENI